MLRWWTLAAAIALALLLMFFAASAAGFAILENPAPLQQDGGVVAAVAGFLLLVGDVFLPIPASLVMIVNGALFGIAGGAALSLAGSVAATLTGFALGRAGTPAIRRLVTPIEHERASALLARWGLVAVAVTRPIPILAETVAILAGSSTLGWRRTTIAATAGSIVPALAYAWAGAHAASTGDQVLIFAGVLGVTGVLWLVSRRFGGGKRVPAGSA